MRTRVLLVEDEYHIACELAVALEQAGLEVMGPVSSLDEAYALVTRDGVPDLAVLDVRLGTELAYPLAESLRAEGTQVVFATAYLRQNLPAELSILPLWCKPFNARDLAHSLHRAAP